jgi:hypothetical protein
MLYFGNTFICTCVKSLSSICYHLKQTLPLITVTGATQQSLGSKENTYLQVLLVKFFAACSSVLCYSKTKHFYLLTHCCNRFLKSLICTQEVVEEDVYFACSDITQMYEHISRNQQERAYIEKD